MGFPDTVPFSRIYSRLYPHPRVSRFVSWIAIERDNARTRTSSARYFVRNRCISRRASTTLTWVNKLLVFEFFSRSGGEARRPLYATLENRPPWNQTNRPHTYEESTMSFRETRHFDINFRETRSISTTFSVPFLRRPSFASRPFIPLGRVGSAGYRGAQSCAHRWKNVPPPPRFLFLFPRTRPPFIHAFFSPPKGPTPSFLESMGPTSIPSPFPLLSLSFSLFYLSPSPRSIGRKRNTRRPTVRCIFFSTYRGKVEVDGERKKKKREKKKGKKYPPDRASCFYFLGKRKRTRLVRNAFTASEFDEFEKNYFSSKNQTSRIITRL